MAGGDSRGGGYDAFIDKQSEKRKTLSSSSRQEVASSAPSGGSSGNMEAPSSLGDLMTPSSPGRAAQPNSPEEYNARVAENQSYLEHPDTRAQMLQFATAMLGGSSPMEALGLAMQMPGRMELAAQARQQKEIENAQKDRALALTERGQNIEMRGQDIQAKGSPSELMKTLEAADEAEKAGDKKGANILRSRAYQIANEFSAPTGQVTTYDENGNPHLTNVPGGKADIETQQALEAARIAKQNELSKGALVTSSADQIITAIDNNPHPDLTITGFGGLLNWVPTSESLTISQAMQNITSNLTVDQLKSIRDSTPTHGAFGNVSNYEDQLLQSTTRALNQKMYSGDLRKSLLTIKFMFDTSTFAEKNRISSELRDGKISEVEAQNQYNNLMNQYVNGNGGDPSSKVTKDFSTPPSYITDPQLRDNWNLILNGMPEEIPTHLSTEDAAAFQQWLKAKQGQ